MRLPRTTKLFRGHLDAAPLLCVLFPLAFFALLHQWIVLPPGTRIELPAESTGISESTREPAFRIGIDAAERIFFENQLVEPEDLATRLRSLVSNPGTPRVVWIYADKAVTHNRLALIGRLARDAGIERVYLGTAPSRTGP